MEGKSTYLECEKRWVFRMLIFVAGFYGGYTMLVRGGVFSNAQTGNIVFCALALGNGDWQKAAYYLIPISAYLLGALFSEVLPKTIKRLRFMRWDTALTLFEILAVILMGFIPASVPHQICQVIVNFICSMQYNTFRQAEGVSMATTFCTNHVRQIGLGLSGFFLKGEKGRGRRKKVADHGLMVLCFMAGTCAATLACRYTGSYAIWFNLIPLTVLFVDLFHADRTKEKELLEEIPSGH